MFTCPTEGTSVNVGGAVTVNGMPPIARKPGLETVTDIAPAETPSSGASTDMAPAGIVTVAGTDAMAGALLVSETTMSVAEVSATSPPPPIPIVMGIVLPTATVDVDSEMKNRGVSVVTGEDAVVYPALVAVNVAEPTATPVSCTLIEVAAAGMVTVAGTLHTDVGAQLSATSIAAAVLPVRVTFTWLGTDVIPAPMKTTGGSCSAGLVTVCTLDVPEPMPGALAVTV